jgi:hypothetical protein
LLADGNIVPRETSCNGGSKTSETSTNNDDVEGIGLRLDCGHGVCRNVMAAK